MRRSSRPLLPVAVTETVVPLARLQCQVCGQMGCMVVALGRDERGASERTWCSVICARTQGWPWLVSEKQSRRRVA